MKYPTNVLYSKSHEWVQFLDDTTALVGLTDFAQDALGDVVFVNLPEVGDSIVLEESFGDVESVKAVSDIFSPVTGEVGEVNGAVLDSPEQINCDPYGTWLIKVTGISQREELLDAAAYEAFCAEEA